MRKQFLIMVCSCMLSAGASGATQPDFNFDKHWKKVESFANKQLPESALRETESILNEAQRRGDFDQTVKAFVHRMRFTREKDRQATQQLTADFETFAAGEGFTAPQRALLHSMTAELYAMHYNDNKWNILNRTPTPGYVPDNIDLWSVNNYEDKITAEIDLSLAEADVLKHTELAAYEALLEKPDMKHSACRPTDLYSFLARRAIRMLSDLKGSEEMHARILTLYAGLEQTAQAQGDVTGVVLAALERLEHERNTDERPGRDERYLKALQDLRARHMGHESEVEIIYRMTGAMLNSPYSRNHIDCKRRIYDLCAEGIASHPRYERTNLLKNRQKSIEAKEINVNLPAVVKPHSPLAFSISSRNTKTLQVKVYRVNATAEQYYDFCCNRDYDDYHYPRRSLTTQTTLATTRDSLFRTVTDTVTVTSGDYGIYEYEVYQKGFESSSAVARGTFVVSDLAMLQRTEDAKRTGVYVLDRMSGERLPDVQVLAYEQEWKYGKTKLKPLGTQATGTEGFCTVNIPEHYAILFAQRGEDRYLSSETYSRYYPNREDKQEDRITLSIFTDRSLYRPGQAVQFKGIAYRMESQQVATNADIKVTLQDANRKDVSEQTFRTNEFGSFSGTFLLPERGLGGAYRLRSDYGSLTIRVEEYKRPTFEVTVDPIEGETFFGKPATFTGSVQSYAGYAVTGAEVKYTITRRTHRWWWGWHEPDRIVADGMVTAGADGQFAVTFTPERTEGNNPFLREQYYWYEMEATATDSRGETQTASHSMAVGDKSLHLNIGLPAKIDKGSDTRADINAETLNGKLVDTDVRYTLQRFADTEVFYEKQPAQYEWTAAEDITSGTFNTRERRLPLDFTTCRPGYYRLTATATDSQGREVTAKASFILYDRAADTPPVKAYLWTAGDDKELRPGEQAEIRIGTSTENLHILYEVMQGSRVLDKRWVVLNNEMRLFNVPFLMAYGDGVYVRFTAVKDEQQFTHTTLLRRRIEERKLTPTWSVFRDKSRPGETAEWTLTIPEAADGKRKAEVMAGMYDASLDAIYPHSWQFATRPTLHVPFAPLWNACGLGNTSSSSRHNSTYNSIKSLCYRTLNWFGYESSPALQECLVTGLFGNRAPGMQVQQKMLANVAPTAVMEDAVEEEGEPIFRLEEEAVTTATGGEIPTPHLRKNFNETAFFYPQLRADKAGRVRIAFTVPESLTRWNVNVLAHTPDLYSGMLQSNVVTQQELMVRPNMPRFVRRSDKWVLTADIVNMTDNTLRATATLQLIDPATDKPIRLADGAPRTIELAGGETRTASWTISEQAAHDLLVVRLQATTGTFSDGEQHYLPVLPDQILVTETLPLTVHGGEKRMFRFDRLLENASQLHSQSLTVEMTSNPAWQAVLALPGMTKPTGKNAIDYYTAYYASVLSAHIASTYPKIAAIFDRWKQSGEDKDALLSNLEKNAELKSVLLDETPWVLEAADETEQHRRIALLFDLNSQKNRTDEYLERLIDLQRPDGGFEWYKGMGASRYVTQTILLGMGRLGRMTGQDYGTEAWVGKALTYTDNKLAQEYADLKRNEKDYNKHMYIGNTQWHYLHLRSEFADMPLAEGASEAVKYYTAQAYRYWTDATLYGKAATALIARRNGQTATSDEIMASLRELALRSDDMGMYWNNRQDARYWDARPEFIQTALIEAFAETGGTREELEAMSLWLLRQKQTQRWQSPLAAADAVYALLQHSGNSLDCEGKVEVKLGNRTLKPAKREAGTGYFKTIITADDITARMGNITVKKSDKGVAWGAAYWQFWQDADKVAESGSGLSVRKLLFVERMENGKKVMRPAASVGIRRGDRVITRLEITSDRHLEYVALKDLRAAGLEPVEQLSGYEWRDGAGYYRTTKDNATHFFFERLPRGTFVLEYESWANNAGDFADGTASIQCLYAPEFAAHSNGGRIVIGNR